MKKIYQSPYSTLFFAGLLVYLLTSFFSLGHHHPDEHFQILEFANYKLGNSPAADLPWEFREKIRPALQPFIAFTVIKTLNLLGIHNPFTYALILRIISALLAWFIICKLDLWLVNRFSTERGKKLFILMSLFLWFMPYISVRFSSENMAGIAFLFGLYLLLSGLEKPSKSQKLFIYIAGLCFGFSFFFRFQMGIALFGLGLWLLFIKRPAWQVWLMLTGAALTAVALCIYLDYWFYGEFVLTPVNYYIVNIIQNRAANWGVFPWWYYFSRFALEAIPPVSIVLLFLFLIGLYKNGTGVFAFVLVPFLLIHMMLGHKELRFLFSIAYAFVYIAALGLDYLMVRLKTNKLYRYGYSVLIFLNVSLLVFIVLTPAQEAVNYYKFVYVLSGNKETTILCTDKSLYNLAGLEVNFYKPEKANVLIFADYKEMDTYLEQNRPGIALVFLCKPVLEYEFTNYSTKRVYTMFPDWLLKYNINHWQDRSAIWSIYEVKRNVLQATN